MLFPILLSVFLGGALSWHIPGTAQAHAFERHVLPRQAQNSSTWPYGPFSTRGRDIVNSRGEVVTWAGVNWPLSGKSMIPEGLEHASVESILDRIASVGFNIIRMPYAIEMIDTLYASPSAPNSSVPNPSSNSTTDLPLLTALSRAHGATNGTALTTAILAHNPIWTASTPRLKIWTDIVRIAHTKRLLIHPDTHVSRAGPCCTHTDGNAWFDDGDFSVANWTRGLNYVARWARNHSNIVSIGLRNEVRESWLSGALEERGYNWVNYVANMSLGAQAVWEGNPGLLIGWGGLGGGEDVSALTAGRNLWTAECYRCNVFRDGWRSQASVVDLGAVPWGGKVVWEMRLDGGSEVVDTESCRIIEARLYRNGMNALGIAQPAACNVTSLGLDCEPAKRLTPVILSEVGRVQNAGLLNNTMMGCLREFTQRHNVSWMMWGVGGSTRGSSGGEAAKDAWGLTNATWDGWQFSEGIEQFWKPWVQNMGLNGTASGGTTA